MDDVPFMLTVVAAFIPIVQPVVVVPVIFIVAAPVVLTRACAAVPAHVIPAVVVNVPVATFIDPIRPAVVVPVIVIPAVEYVPPKILIVVEATPLTGLITVDPVFVSVFVPENVSVVEAVVEVAIVRLAILFTGETSRVILTPGEIITVEVLLFTSPGYPPEHPVHAAVLLQLKAPTVVVEVQTASDAICHCLVSIKIGRVELDKSGNPVKIKDNYVIDKLVPIPMIK